MLKSEHRLFHDCATACQIHNLRQISYIAAFGCGDGAACWHLLASDYSQHSAFARPVLSCKGYSVAVANDKGDLPEQRPRAKFHTKIINSYHFLLFSGAKIRLSAAFSSL